eukprot:jgi/Tetstr1/427817/TSEL_001789.t1
MTPLMVAATSGGGFRSSSVGRWVAVARELLAAGAGVTAAAGSNARLTAADYAAASGKPRLSAELRELEAGGTARSQQIPEAAQQRLDVLCHPLLHAVNRRDAFTREFTEALAMLARLEALVAPGTSGGNSHRFQPGECRHLEDPWHVVDLCCGKGFLATLVATTFPQFQVTAVDRLGPAFLPHFKEAGIVNVTYAQLDIMAPDFLAKMQALVAQAGGRRTAVLGMHLLRAMDVLAALPEVKLLLLAPCCLPCKQTAEDTPAEVFQPQSEAGKHAAWCDFLEARMRGQGDGRVSCSQEVEAGVISERRTLLTGIKSELAAAQSIS